MAEPVIAAKVEHNVHMKWHSVVTAVVVAAGWMHCGAVIRAREGRAHAMLPLVAHGD